MTDACQYLHDMLSRLPRLKRENLTQVPKTRIYVLFENGEHGHGGDRIVIQTTPPAPSLNSSSDSSLRSSVSLRPCSVIVVLL